jgi:hypothetical protein
VILATASILLGVASVWLAITTFRNIRSREGDFSEWIVSNATPINRRLWIANAWVRFVAVAVAGPLLVGLGLWLAFKN